MVPAFTFHVPSCRYTVTGSLSLVAAKRAICFDAYTDKSSAPCSFSNIPFMLLFGGLNVLWAPPFGSITMKTFDKILMRSGLCPTAFRNRCSSKLAIYIVGSRWIAVLTNAHGRRLCTLVSCAYLDLPFWRLGFRFAHPVVWLNKQLQISEVWICRFSQIPDFGNLWWLSYLAASMSFAYVGFRSPSKHLYSERKVFLETWPLLWLLWFQRTLAIPSLQIVCLLRPYS